MAVMTFLWFLHRILIWIQSSVPAGGRSVPFLASAKGSKEWKFWIADINTIEGGHRRRWAGDTEPWEARGLERESAESSVAAQ